MKQFLKNVESDIKFVTLKNIMTFRRNFMRTNIFTCMAAVAMIASACSNSTSRIDSLGVPVTQEENREYSYTD